MGPWGKSISRHPGINYRGNNRRSAAIRADFAEKNYTDRRATFVGQCRTLSAASRGLPWSAARGRRSLRRVPDPALSPCRCKTRRRRAALRRVVEARTASADPSGRPAENASGGADQKAPVESKGFFFIEALILLGFSGPCEARREKKNGALKNERPGRRICIAKAFSERHSAPLVWNARPSVGGPQSRSVGDRCHGASRANGRAHCAPKRNVEGHSQAGDHHRLGGAAGCFEEALTNAGGELPQDRLGDRSNGYGIRKRRAFAKRKYFRTNWSLRPANGSPHTRQETSAKAVSGPASALTT
jgi:hypothetical protein